MIRHSYPAIQVKLQKRDNLRNKFHYKKSGSSDSVTCYPSLLHQNTKERNNLFGKIRNGSAVTFLLMFLKREIVVFCIEWHCNYKFNIANKIHKIVQMVINIWQQFIKKYQMNFLCFTMLSWGKQST